MTETDHYLPIHREAPAFVEQATEQEILVTGIKVSYQLKSFLLSLLAVHLFLRFLKKWCGRIRNLFCLYILTFRLLVLSADYFDQLVYADMPV